MATTYIELEKQKNMLANYAYKLEFQISELLAWAESVEGHKVSNNITKGKDTIFENARRLLKNKPI